MWESVPLPTAHVTVEQDGGAVVLTIDSEDAGVEYVLLMSPAEAREFGNLIYRIGAATL